MFFVRYDLRVLSPNLWLLFSLLFSHSVCLTLCNPMDCSTPGFPVLHHLPELAQTHVHWVSDAIQPSHPLSSPFPLAFNLSQHQVFSNESALCLRWQSIGASASASVLPMNIQGWYPLGLTGVISLQSKRLSRAFFSTKVQKHWYFDAQLSLWSNSHSFLKRKSFSFWWSQIYQFFFLL